MTLKDTLQSEMVSTLKSQGEKKDAALHYSKIRLTTLRAALGSITEAETSGKSRHELDDAAVISVLRKMVKQREDSASIFGQANETERELRELYEAQVLSEFLPSQLDEDATRVLVQSIITEKGLEGPRAIGQVMGALKGRTDVDTGLASRIARESL